MQRTSKVVVLFTLLFSLHFFSNAGAQLEPFGLEGENVTSLSLFPKWSSEWGHAVCVGTDSGGVYVREVTLPGSRWVNLGLEMKRVTAVFVYHTGVGPMDFDTIIAGVKPHKAAGDSTLLYKYTYGFDTTWATCDIWLDADSIDCIQAICGYAYSGHLPPQPLFIGDGSAIFRSYLVEVGGYWEKVWSLNGDARINVIHIAKEWPCCSPLWAGGETENSEPILMKSLDKGDTWDNVSPDAEGENTCYSIASHPDYSDIVYAGMIGVVIKTTDGGEHWSVTSLEGFSVDFTGLAIDPSNPEHVFAGGTMSDNSFALYESFDGGDSWIEILLDGEVAGITCMVADTLHGECVAYMGTSGSGVFRYLSRNVSVNETGKGSRPKVFFLHQNYSNPFNTRTRIRYQIADSRSPLHTTLKIYNILGQKVRTLVDGFRETGYYSVIWDGRDSWGRDVPSGVYWYRLEAGDFATTQKMVLVR